jgi:hypothetical protein
MNDNEKRALSSMIGIAKKAGRVTLGTDMVCEALRANAKNKLGKVILTATYKGINYTKEIKVAPLW